MIQRSCQEVPALPAQTPGTSLLPEERDGSLENKSKYKHFSLFIKKVYRMMSERQLMMHRIVSARENILN